MANRPSEDALWESNEVVDAIVYGFVSDEVKEMLSSRKPRYMNYYGGYSK